MTGKPRSRRAAREMKYATYLEFEQDSGVKPKPFLAPAIKEAKQHHFSESPDPLSMGEIHDAMCDIFGECLFPDVHAGGSES